MIFKRTLPNPSSVIKKIKIELVVIGLLLLNFFISSDIDSSFYNKLNNFYNSSSNVYFKQFFINITKIGDSFWVFLLSFLTYLLCYFFKNKMVKNHKNICDKIRISALFLFAATLVTGILTQILKHIVGRPRPNQVLEHGYFEFDFFNFNSAFHSFPSGHTSTIFVVALTFSIFTPKLKYFYLFCASIIAFSRMVVGAHFFTDVVGGIVLAYIGFKITITVFEKLKMIQYLYLIKKLNSDIFLLSIIIFLIIIIFVSVGSSVDIHISALFYQEQQKFILQSNNLITIFIRKIILPLIITYLLILPTICLFLPINKIYFNFKINIKEALFIFLSLLFNLLVVVNIILKDTWGRARPNDILEFAGKEDFTPWFYITNACETNCSFVSGDASVGFSIISLFFITKNKIFFWMSLFFGFVLGATRILEGGHFFSDVLIAGFLIFILTYFQHYFYQKRFLNYV